MYSSNVSEILLPVKLVVRSAGVALANTGGSESLGPPVGVPICAQPLPKSEKINPAMMIKKKLKRNVMGAKIEGR